MDKGAAILDYGPEFGPWSNKAMSNDGPNLADNNLSANKVTPYNKQEVSPDDTTIEIQASKGAKNFGATKQASYEGSELED
jgi:hypothetical protein